MKTSAKRWVKLAAITSVVALGSLGLSGCSGSGSSGVQKLTFTNFYTGSDLATLRSMVKKFNSTHKNIVVSNQAIDGNTLQTQLPNQVAAGKAPDVVMGNDLTLGQWAAQGALYNFSSPDLSTMKVSKSDYLSNFWNWGTQSGKLYGIPFGSTATAMYYNKTLMQAKGISKPPTTLAELISDGQKCTVDKAGVTSGHPGFDASNVATYGLGLPIEWGAQMGDSVLAQVGGSLTNSSYAPTLDTEEGQKAISLVQDLTTKHAISPANLGWQTDLANFKAGHSCFMQNGVWELSDIKASGLKWGITTIPTMGEKPSMWAGAAWLVLPKQRSSYDSAKRSGALTFISWMTSQQGSLQWTESGNLTVRPDVLSSSEYKSRPIAVIANALSTAYVPTGFPWVSQVQNPWASAYSKVLAGKAQPAAALTAAQKDSEQEVASARQNYPNFKP